MKEFTQIPEAPFPRHWLMGHTNAFAGSTLGFVKECMDAGLDMARAKIAFRDFVFLLHPELVREVLQNQQHKYRKSFAYNGLKAFLGQGLLTSEGDFWLKQRRTMQPGFYRKTLAHLQTTMQEKAAAYAYRLIPEHITQESQEPGFSKSSQPNPQDSLQGFFLDLTREITSDCLFGPGRIDLENARRMNTALADLRFYANARLKNPFSPPPWVPTGLNRRFHKARAVLRSVVEPIIDQKAAGENDLLGMLMGLQDPETGEGMSPQQLYDEVLTLFVAGQETTSNALTFGMKLLADHPEVIDLILQEALENKGNSIPYPYTDAVIKEILRLYPPAWAMSREAIEDTSLAGYQIPTGTTVFLSIYALQRHPDFWERPLEFLPERWLDKGLRMDAYFPFGAGARKCIGDHFAMMEMREVLLALVTKLKWVFAPDQPFDLITPMTLNYRVPIMVQWEGR